jgi:hypothetical protein
MFDREKSFERLAREAKFPSVRFSVFEISDL